MNGERFDPEAWFVAAFLSGQHYRVVRQPDGSDGLCCEFRDMPPVTGPDGEDTFPEPPPPLTRSQARELASYLRPSR